VEGPREQQVVVAPGAEAAREADRREAVVAQTQRRFDHQRDLEHHGAVDTHRQGLRQVHADHLMVVTVAELHRQHGVDGDREALVGVVGCSSCRMDAL